MSPVVPRFGRVGQQTRAGLAGSDIGHSFELVAAASLHLHRDHLEKTIHRRSCGGNEGKDNDGHRFSWGGAPGKIS